MKTECESKREQRPTGYYWTGSAEVLLDHDSSAPCRSDGGCFELFGDFVSSTSMARGGEDADEPGTWYRQRHHRRVAARASREATLERGSRGVDQPECHTEMIRCRIVVVVWIPITPLPCWVRERPERGGICARLHSYGLVYDDTEPVLAGRCRGMSYHPGRIVC